MQGQSTFLGSFFYFKIISMTGIVLLILSFIKRYVDGPAFIDKNAVDLTGKTAVITGGNSGIGLQTAKELALRGCRVFIGARNRYNAEQTIQKIKLICPKAEIQYIPLDLADRQSIKNFAIGISSESVEYLVNNAGIMGLPQRKVTKEGLQMQWAVNHLGHFYLSYLLWDKIKKAKFFRIVNISSRGHYWYLGFFKIVNLDFDNINFEKDYDAHLSYSRSKLYNVLFTRALASKINNTSGLVVSVNPGVVRTEIIRELTGDGIKGNILACLLRLVWPFWCLFTKSPKQGASTTLFTLLDENVKNGYYYTASKEDQENPCVNQDSWKRLWELSEASLNVSFVV